MTSLHFRVESASENLGKVSNSGEHAPSSNHQMHNLHSAVRQLLQQFYKQFAGESGLVGCKPERPLGIDSERGADPLALARTIDYPCLGAHAPSLAMHGISAKTGFVPEENIRPQPARKLGKGWEGIMLPKLYKRSRHLPDASITHPCYKAHSAS
jgi:hypothetical protein